MVAFSGNSNACTAVNGGGLMDYFVSPVRKIHFQGVHQCSFSGFAITVRAQVVIPEPGIGRKKCHIAFACGAIAFIFEYDLLALERPDHAPGN